MWLPATSLYGHGDLHEQIEAVTRRLEQAPAAELYLQRGELHRAHHDYPAALADYDRAEARDAKLDAVLLARGRALLEAGRYQEAEKALDRFIKRQPGHAASYLHRARAGMALKRFAQAAADYERSIELSATPSPDLYLERADALKAGGKREEALRCLEQGLAKLGPLVTLETAALEIEVELKRHDAALVRVDRLMTGAPRKELWQERKAAILAEAGRREDARQMYEQALASIAALPQRLRNVRATQHVERRLRAALAAFVPERS